MTDGGLLPGRKLSLGELLDATFRIYRRYFKTLALTAGALLVPLQILFSILLSIVFRYHAVDAPVSRWISFITLPQLQPDPTTSDAVVLSVLGLGVGIVIGVANLIVTLALIWLGIEYLHQREHTFTEAWRSGKSYFWPYLGLLVLQGLILGIPLFLMSMFFLVSPGLGIAAMILMLIIVVYVTIRWFVAPVALLDQDLGSSSALGYSWRMVGPQFWRVFAYVGLLLLLNIAIVSMPQYALQSLIISITPPHLYRAAMPFISAVTSILTALWQPIYLIAMVMLYFNLRVKQDDNDLEERVREMENQDEPLQQFLGQDDNDLEERMRETENQDESLQQFLDQVDADLEAMDHDAL